MIGHHIVSGELNSAGKPSSVSEEVIASLNDFSGLVIADEINMAGLKSFYQDKTEQYVGLINAGENLILDFDLNPVSLYKLILEIEKEVEKGRINEEKIDKSVRKILKMKGYKVV
jgi:beta-glucosidase-like glycosyl hydrolase